jgi:RNA polymerase sigma-70 factor (ECF subfamily)
LRPISRTVFILRDIEGLTIDQTAVALNLSQAAVKARLWRVRLQLREALSKHFGREKESARINFTALQNQETNSLTAS